MLRYISGDVKYEECIGGQEGRQRQHNHLVFSRAEQSGGSLAERSTVDFEHATAAFRNFLSRNIHDERK